MTWPGSSSMPSSPPTYRSGSAGATDGRSGDQASPDQAMMSGGSVIQGTADADSVARAPAPPALPVVRRHVLRDWPVSLRAAVACRGGGGRVECAEPDEL